MVISFFFTYIGIIMLAIPSLFQYYGYAIASKPSKLTETAQPPDLGGKCVCTCCAYYHEQTYVRNIFLDGFVLIRVPKCKSTKPKSAAVQTLESRATNASGLRTCVAAVQNGIFCRKQTLRNAALENVIFPRPFDVSPIFFDRTVL